MKLFVTENQYIDTNQPLDISIPLSGKGDNLTAWYVDQPKIEPVRGDGFVGLVSAGGSVNFQNIFFNPHGHGTHTECLGHITPEIYSVNDSLTTFFFTAQVVSIEPETVAHTSGETDEIINIEQLKTKLNHSIEALIIRTLPNDLKKKHLNYSTTNPPYLDPAIVDLLNEYGVKHILVDLPSVDRENDEGKLAFHHAFWQVPANPQFDKTITEFVYVADSITDGDYILNLQTAPFENDASPSRPVLYKIQNH